MIDARSSDTSGWSVLAAVAVGGAIGALARAALVEWTVAGPPPGADQVEWPWVTWAINVWGAFVLGLAVTSLRERSRPSRLRWSFVGPGFCGALTTFSAMQFELAQMLEAGDLALAGAYLTTSVTAAYLAVVAATAAVRRRR